MQVLFASSQTASGRIGLWRRSEPLAFGGSSLSAVGIISTVGLSMFPFILPSSLDPRASLATCASACAAS